MKSATRPVLLVAFMALAGLLLFFVYRGSRSPRNDLAAQTGAADNVPGIESRPGDKEAAASSAPGAVPALPPGAAVAPKGSVENVLAPGAGSAAQDKAGKQDMLTQATAIELARKACAGKVALPANCEVRVNLLQECYDVMFLEKQPDINSLRGDYIARVTVDARTGKILSVLAGS